MTTTETMKAIPWWQPLMGEREKELVCRVIDSGFINDGEYTDAFAKRVAEICGVPYAVAVTSGTAAIFLALAAAGVGHGDEVIVPDITFVATANAVKLAGAEPVLVDVKTDDFTIDPQLITDAITPRTRAIVPVHVSGRGAAMAEIIEIARRHDLAVIEDAAEALGSGFGGKPLGSFGDAACFSFTANKTIATGQGGMIVTSSEDLYWKLRELKDQGRPVRGTGGADVHQSVGYNFKLTNVQAAIGLAQLETFEQRRARLRRLYSLYSEHLGGNPKVRLPHFDVAGGACPQWVDVYVEEERDSLVAHLTERQIETRQYWFPVHTQVPYRADDSKFPNSIDVSAKGLWLPSAYTLTEDDVRLVCESINEWSAR